MRDMSIVFEPVSIGKATIKNRLVFPAMCTSYSDDQGSVTPQIKEFVRARAAGGVGMSILPGTLYGTAGSIRPAISEGHHIKGWQELKEVASAYGMGLFCQLHPPNARLLEKASRPDDCTLDQIRWFVQAYAEGALRAKEAGLDGIEIRLTGSTEVGQFLSPSHNHRHDAYGGELAGRSRLAIEIVRTVKRTAGSDFPVILLLNGEEGKPGERELSEPLQLARLLEDAGADALHVTGEGPSPHVTGEGPLPMEIPPGHHVSLASEVKRVVAIPVIAVGRINDLSLAAKIIAEGHADLVAMGRALLADPALPTKSAEGRRDEIRRCIACNQACRPISPGGQTFCLQNPRTGRETTLLYNRVSPMDVKTILIAGAGPAGLEAACVLAERGHRVRIYEQGSEAGGTLLLASKPPFKRGMLEVINYRLRCLKRLGVEVNFNKTVDLKALEDAVPDILFVATGSSPDRPSFTTNGKGVYTADQVLSGKVPDGKKVLLVGDGMIACEVADYLANRGYDIDMAAESKSVAGDLEMARRVLLLERLKNRGVRFVSEAKVLEVELPQAKLAIKGQQEICGDYDAAVYTLRRPNNQLADVARNCSFPLNVFVVGDAYSPRTAVEAIREASQTGAEV